MIDRQINGWLDGCSLPSPLSVVFVCFSQVNLLTGYPTSCVSSHWPSEVFGGWSTGIWDLLEEALWQYTTRWQHGATTFSPLGHDAALSE